VAISFLGLFTEILFWPFLAAQILWTMVVQWATGRPVPRLVSLQAVAIMLGAPLWAHAI
jgi:hypothetical protein